MTSSDAARAHQNLIEYGRWTTTLEPDARLLEAGGTLALALSADWPSFRQAVCTDDTAPAEAWVATAHDFLADLGDTACFLTREGPDDEARRLLLERGYVAFGTVPSMLCETVPEERSPADGVTIRLAESDADVAQYAAVAGQAFVDLGLLEEPTRQLLDNPTGLLADDVILAVGEVDGQIVAGAFARLTAEGTSAYVSFVSVLADARGRALGDAVTRRVTREAFERGVSSLSLEASKFGENTYRRMGYRDLFRYHLMIRLPAS